MVGSNQLNQQFVVVDQEKANYFRGTTKVALFDEVGRGVSLPNAQNDPVNVSDSRFLLDGTVDNTSSILSAISFAESTKRNIHFSSRPLGQPYVVKGSGTIIPIPAGVSITSDKNVVVKVADNNGDYKTIFGPSGSADLSGFCMDGLTVDQNASGNIVSSVSKFYVEGTQRFVLYIGAGTGDHVRVENCTFKNVDGLNTLYLGSPTMQNVVVRNNDFLSVGNSPAWHDHSTIYTSCDGSTITDNRFYGILGSNGATTAIETHGPNQIVANNRVTSYKIGANITGITNLGNDTILVKGNEFYNVLIGVQLWSWKPTEGTTLGLRDVKIIDNIITIKRDPWSIGASDFARGICLNQSASGGRILDNIYTLSIVGNSIRYLSTTVFLTNDYQNSCGIELVSQDTSVEIQDLKLLNNDVTGSLGPALRIGVRIRRARIRDNDWKDSFSTNESPATFWRSSVCITGNADLIDVRMSGNQSFDTRGTHKLVQGWATSFSGGNTVTRCEEWDNPIICTDGSLLSEKNQATASKRFSARGVSTGRRMETGLYHTAEGGTPTTLALTVNQEYAIPIDIGNQMSISEIAANVTVVGTAGAVLRYGIRYDNGNGAPGTLLADLDVVSSTTLASRAITVSQVIPAGRMWLTITAQVAGCTVTAISGWLVGASGATSVAGAIGGRSAHYQTGVSGALPQSFTSGGQTPNAPVVFIKAV